MDMRSFLQRRRLLATRRERRNDIMTKVNNLQDAMLNELRKEHMPITVHLVNGVPLKGTIKGFDNFVLLLDCEGKQMMVYKHAVSSVTPARPITVSAASAAQE